MGCLLMSLPKLPVGNSFDVFIDRLKKASDQTGVTDAQITATLYDADSEVVEGCDGIALTGDGEGSYRCTLTPTIDLESGSFYRIVLQASNYTLRWEQWCEAISRDFER